MWSGRGSCLPLLIGTHRSRWRNASASAGRRYGGGNNALPRAGSRGCCATRLASPKAPIAAETTARVVALTCTAPPHQATHWTGRAMAKAIGISVGSVQRIWRAHQLQPHRLRTFKRSRDPSFATKLTDIVGLYIDPPAHAVVLSIDEK